MKEQRRPAWMQMGVVGGARRKRRWVGWREGCVKGGGGCEPAGVLVQPVEVLVQHMEGMLAESKAAGG
jgi:hypothetical protein